MIKKLNLILICLFVVQSAFAQMSDNGVTKYGNEWIVEGQSYYKIKIVQDGVYRIDHQTLKNAGFPGDINGSSIQLFKNGLEVPVIVSNSGNWSGSDFLTFNGYYNKSEIDKYSFPNSTEDIVNPKASIYSDTAVYFLTINNNGNLLRTTIVNNDLNNPPAAETSINRISELDFKELCNSKTEYYRYVVDGQPQSLAYINTPFVQGKGMVAGAYNQTYSLDCPGLITSDRLPVFHLRGVTSPGDLNLNLGHDLKFYMQDRLMHNAYASTQKVLYVKFSYADTFGVIKPLDNKYTLTNGHPLDQIRVGYISINYPAATIVTDSKPLKFTLESGSSDRYIEFENLSGVAGTPYITDSLGSFKISGSIDGNKIKFKIPSIYSSRPLILFTMDPYQTISAITPVSLKSFKNFDAQYVILSHARLMEGTAGNSAAEQYTEYRRSTAGGAYKSELIDVKDIYNSFGYGLDYNPMSVKNFASYLGQSGLTKFMFILGRGRDYKEIRSDADLKTAISRGYGVPSFGDFGSDNLLVSKDFDRLSLNMAVGRLPAVNQDEVLVYLNKIRNSELAYNAPGDNESKQWTKNIIQLNGGNVGKSDQAAIASSQKDAEELIKSNKIAGFVTTFLKGSNETIGKASQDYFDLVNKGVSVVDYFGHGALTSLEYPVDIPSKYNNSPRLPILIIKGCKTGNCQRDGSSIPSKLLYEDSYKNSGFRAVIGSISDSELYSLSNLARQFYTLWGGTMYGKTFGEIFQSTFNTPGLNASSESIQQIYVGDPALGVKAFPGPDFRIKPGTVTTEPSTISTIDNKFKISFEIENLGTNHPDTLFYDIIYENSDKKTVSKVTKYVINPKSSHLHTEEFELDKTSTLGENTIYITLDPLNKIAESVAPQAELNNEYKNSLGQKGFKFFIKSSSLIPVYPLQYAIIDTNKITLTAFSETLTNTSRQVNWYLDTTDKFDSPLLQFQIIHSISGHIEWNPPVELIENKTYFWKVVIDSIASESVISANSSFIYIKNKNGFAQEHNGQFRKNIIQSLAINGGGNHINFDKRNFYFKYTNGYFDTNSSELGLYRETGIVNSGRPQLAYSQNTEGLLGIYWYRKDSMFVSFPLNQNPYGSIQAPGISNRNYLMFESENIEGRKAIINFIENVAQNDDIIVFHTYQNNPNNDLHISEWANDSITSNGINIFNLLEKYGAKQVRNLQAVGSKPYLFTFKKSSGIMAEELYNNNIIINEVNTLCNGDEGSMQQIFGPAAEWNTFELYLNDSIGRKDIYSIELTAMHKNNSELNYSINATTSNSSELITIDLQSINAEIFPNITAKITIKDPLIYRGKMDNFKYFRFIATELPEATLLSQSITSSNDTINQGDLYSFSIRSKNLGKYAMDSMLVKFTLRTENDQSKQIISRFEKLEISAESLYTFMHETNNLKGNVEFICEMNPDGDQNEAYHGNNLFSKKIFIKGDIENPLVDATFDGERIFNGDIVSSKPLIKITVRDENKIFPLDNPDLFNVFLVNSFGQDTLISLSSPEMKFYPANFATPNSKNEAIVEFKPSFDLYPESFSGDGEYSIRVTAKDVAGNQSGKYDFEKRFRIINKKSVSDVFNYPNPFSNSTKFVFTLTGHELPTYYKMQIMSVSGKVVREITQDELGPLKIGKHLSNYVWDGTDQFGDKLANGVYLYRMIILDQDKKKYEKFDVGKNTDQFFDGGWGKMVIIR